MRFLLIILASTGFVMAQSVTPDSLPSTSTADETGSLLIEQHISGRSTNDTQQITVANLFSGRTTVGGTSGNFNTVVGTNKVTANGLTLGTGAIIYDIPSTSIQVNTNTWFKGRQAIGPQSGGVDGQHWLYSFVLDNTAGANVYNTGVYITTAPAVVSAATKYSLIDEMLAAGATNQTGTLAAQFGKAQYDGSGYVATLINTKYDTKLFDNCTGTVGEMDGIQYNLYATAGGQVTNAFNEHFLAPLALGVTNFPGIVAHQLLEDITVGATNYGIRVNSDNIGVTFGKTTLSTVSANTNGVHSTTKVGSPGFQLTARTSTPTGGELGANGAIFWNSNTVVYISTSTDGSSVTTKQIAP